MYIDLIVLIVLILLVIMFFKRFSSFVFFVAIVDIFLRILTFIKNNIGLKDVSAIIGKYIPENIISIIHKYSSGVVATILDWAFVVIMIIFLSYIIKIFMKKRKYKTNKTTYKSFFILYINLGDIMKIYLDVVFFINFFIDFILLYGTKKILKRKTSLKRLLLGSITGSLTVLYIFLDLTTIKLFIYKLIISILIIIITFGLKNIKQNLIYFYILSIILGGSMYLLDITKIYKNNVIVNNPYIINFILLLITTPIIIILYIKEHKNYKVNITNKHLVEIKINEETLTLEAILDTGNNLIDPYKKRPIILIDKQIELKRKRPIYVPYKALNTEGVIKCILPDKVTINNKEFKNCLIGLSKDKFSINGESCILPNQFKEDLC